MSSSRILSDLRKFGKTAWNITFKHQEFRGRYWKTVFKVLLKNPKGVKAALIMMAFYVHIGPFSRKLVKLNNERIKTLQSAVRTTIAEPLIARSHTASA